MSYALYKFHKAILSLYGTELQKRQWLASSYVHHIVHLRNDDLPPPIRTDFENLRRMLTRIQGNGMTDTLEQSVNAMSNDEVGDAVNRIVALHDALRRTQDATQDA
jgi:hypothetical protein